MMMVLLFRGLLLADAVTSSPSGHAAGRGAEDRANQVAAEGRRIYLSMMSVA